MSICHDRIEVHTNGKGLHEITDEVQSKIDKCRVQTGTATVFIQHTSCSVVIMENADPTARRDLEEFFDRLVPEDADYFTHSSEGSDDMPSHSHGPDAHQRDGADCRWKNAAGTWQGIFLFEHRRATHRRKVLVAIIGE